MGRWNEISRWSSGGRVRKWGIVNFCTVGPFICTGREGEEEEEGGGVVIVGLSCGGVS